MIEKRKNYGSLSQKRIRIKGYETVKTEF